TETLGSVGEAGKGVTDKGQRTRDKGIKEHAYVEGAQTTKIMNINKYTEKAQEAILAAQQLADREGHPEIAPEHLLLTLVEQREGIVPEIIRKMNAGPAAIAAALRAELERLPRAQGSTQVALSPRLRQVTNA